MYILLDLVVNISPTLLSM